LPAREARNGRRIIIHIEVIKSSLFTSWGLLLLRSRRSNGGSG
jgi:hypothetical protein